ncbi:MAG: hypothetical protein IT422_04950 [Pirellulaceae bacterium]|nr:hypothetical protein [Pirellulaceae bacterium]
MKRDALSHPKMLDLASRLDCSRAQAIGIMTLLFDFAATYAPQGDVGKHRNGAIARACDWNEDACAFVSSLVESGWLDESAAHRLVIHDWSDHCEQWVRLKLQKLKLDFLSAEAITEASTVATVIDATEAIAEASPPRDLAKPSPNPNPNVAKDSKRGEPPSDIDRKILDFWNSTMGQRCTLTDKRRKAVHVRVRDPAWLDSWSKAVSIASKSDFCRGINDRGWVADLEWFLKPDSVAKLIEGKYDNRDGPKKSISSGVTHKTTPAASYGEM